MQRCIKTPPLSCWEPGSGSTDQHPRNCSGRQLVLRERGHLLPAQWVRQGTRQPRCIEACSELYSFLSIGVERRIQQGPSLKELTAVGWPRAPRAT